MALSLLEEINRLLNPWKRRILLMAGKAIITAVKDTGKLQVLQLEIMKDELTEDVERIQEYGFSSRPPADSEAVLLCIGGDRANAVVIATDSAALRPRDLADGDSVLYNKAGVKVWAKGDLLRLLTVLYNTNLDTIINTGILNHTHLDGTGAVTSNAQASPSPTLPADFKKGDS